MMLLGVSIHRHICSAIPTLLTEVVMLRDALFPFQHEPYLDFSQADIAEQQRAAYAYLRAQGP